MVGNDVVDLRDRESDSSTLHPRFDARVFATSERDALGASADPKTLRWQLWAAKEAAYKAMKKADSRTVWSPVRFVATFEREANGRRRGVVAHEAGSCEVSIETSHGAVHAVARFRTDCTDSTKDTGRAKKSGEGVIHEFLRIGDERPADLSSLVRSFSKGRLAQVLGVSARDLEIRKRGRVPCLFVHGAPSTADLSLSHHGRLVAFACELGGASQDAFGGAP